MRILASGRGLGIRARLGLLALAVGVAGGPRLALGDDSARLQDYFGFLPLEVYKLDNRIAGVMTRDLDGDKAEDILVVNNARSRIDLLLTSKRPEGEPEGDQGREVNDVPSDRRLRLVSLPVSKQVVSLQVGDFNGDGRADLVFYGQPSGIEIHHNRGNGRFGDVRKLNLGEGIEAPSALAVDDFDRDGRDDLALLTKDEIVLVTQPERGKLGEPVRLPHALDNPRMVKLVDLDGDGQLDIVLLNGGSEDSIRVRFAAGKGTFGPEERLTVEGLRAYAFGEVDGKPGQELGMIEQQSGRVRVLTLGVGDEEESRRGRASTYPLPPGSTTGRSIALGDLDGDGAVEVVASDPGKGQMFLYRRSGAGLGPASAFPSLAGGGPVRVADVDGDGRAEVYVLSEKEKQIARSTLANGRLTFPSPLPTEGDPVALEVADIDGDKKPEVVYVTRGKAETSTADAFTLRALTLDQGGKFAKHALRVDLKGIGGIPPRLVVADINRDDQPDVLVFDPFGPPVLLMGRKGDSPVPASGGLGPLADAGPGALTVADLDGPSLLVAQQGFARKIRRDADGQWSVAEQFDAGRPSAQVQAAAVLDIDGDGTKEVALYDRASKSILFLGRKDGAAYAPVGKVAIGNFDDFDRLLVADLDGDKTDDLLLAGASRFVVVSTGQPGRKFQTIASYESNRNEARLGDLIIGDLNADGRPDLVLTDVAEHFVEIASYEAGRPDLARGASFKVFEKKGGGRRSIGDLIEPRDMTLGDVDGDGRTDLILIVHDRVLVYRQDPGPGAPAEKPRADDKPKLDKDAVKAADSR